MSAKSSTSEKASSLLRFRSMRVKLFASLLAIACGIGAEAAALEVGDAPPRIDMQDRSGKRVDLRELEGSVVIVSFWASWCGPCKEEMPFLETLYRKHAQHGLVVVGVNIDSRLKKMEAFLKEVPVTFRVVHDPKAVVASRYEPRVMPTSYLVGRGGKLRYVHEGFEPEDTARVEARVGSLLDATSPR